MPVSQVASPTVHPLDAEPVVATTGDPPLIVLVGNAAELLDRAKELALDVPQCRVVCTRLDDDPGGAATRAGSANLEGLIVDLRTAKATWAGDELDLTEPELVVLAMLSRLAGAVCGYRDIDRALGGRPGGPINKPALRALMSRLRKKIPTVDIACVRGRGYSLRLPTQRSAPLTASPPDVTQRHAG